MDFSIVHLISTSMQLESEDDERNATFVNLDESPYIQNTENTHINAHFEARLQRSNRMQLHDEFAYKENVANYAATATDSEELSLSDDELEIDFDSPIRERYKNGRSLDAATDAEDDEHVNARIAQLLKKNKIIQLHRKVSENSIENYANRYKRQKIIKPYDFRFPDVYERIKRRRTRKYYQQNMQTFYENVVRYKYYFDYAHEEAKRLFEPCLQEILERSSVFTLKPDKEVEHAKKERLLCLKEGNEVKYRAMINELKNKRLASILETTDEHLFNMMQMVKRHKHSQKTGRPAESYTELSKRKYELLLSGEYVHLEEGSDVGEERVTVKKVSDNSVLKGNHAPKLKNLHQWLLKNPDWTWDAEDALWNEMDGYDQDLDKNATHEESYYSMAHKVKEKIPSQPNILVNGTLKPYQLKGLEWLVSLHNNKLNGILADEMGLGKTIQTIALITYMMESKELMGPYLIIVPLSTLSNWQMEFANWAPSVKVLSYKGNTLNRREVQYEMRLKKFNVVLTTYEYIIKDKAVLAKFPWTYVIVDEGHRIKNQECRLTQVLNTYYYRSAARLLLTGTPLQNKLTELWALLNFLLPDIFKSVCVFEDWFSAPFAVAGESAALNEEETILIIRRLHKVLRPFLLRRLKKEVEHQLPQKVEHVIKCEMSGLQRVLYKHMQSKGVLLTDGSEQGRSGGGVKALMNTIVQLRKICNHPFIYDHIENNYAKHKGVEVTGVDLYRVAGKFELLDRILPKLQASNHRVLLFCQMTQCLNILEDYLTFREVQYLRLDGSTKAEDRALLLSQFNSANSPYFLFLLSTRAGGLGLNLQTADTVIIFDSDWNPHQDLQAQDRAHRIGQRNEVRVFRLITANSVEERILSAARFKLSMDEKVIQAGMFNQKSTDVERRKFLQGILQQTESEEQELGIPDDEEMNLLLARNEQEICLFKDIDNEYKRRSKRELGKRKRLISESELPKWLTDNEQVSQEDFSEEVPQLGRTRLSTRLSLGDSVESYATMKEESDLDSEDSEEEADTSLKRMMRDIIQDVIDYHDEQGRYVSDMFLKLPTKRQLPDYYEVIEQPVDIKKLIRRISLNMYDSLDELRQDFILMCNNAQIYNEPTSQIFADADAMQAIFHNSIRKKLTKSFTTQSNVLL